MRLTKTLAVCVALSISMYAVAQDQEPPVKGTDASFWLAPKADLDLSKLVPVSAHLLATPEAPGGFAMIKTGVIEPSPNYVPARQDLVPLVAEKDTGYRIESKGLKPGSRPFGDRKYKLKEVPDALSGLTLLQTKMGHKSVVDGRFSVIVSVEKPSYVFLALDERALGIYKKFGTPSWLQEYAPTDLKITTDEPIMTESKASFLVFVKKVSAGRVSFGPPSLDEDKNAMYFACFAEAK
jgi:hypothetical protein